MINILRSVYLVVNIAIVITLLTIHFVFKESSYKSSLFFYTFPLPIIILIVLILSILLKKKIRKYNLIIAGLLLIVWLSRSFKISIAETIKEKDLEVVFWNAAHDRNFEEAFNENKGIPDVLVLVEQGDYDIERIQLKYPQYYFYKSIKEISIFSKTPLKILKETTSNFKTNIISFETNNLNFYVVDVPGSMDVPREWELKYVDELVEIKENTIVLGDFNVPYESIHLKNIKTHFNHAFNEKGNGFRETWFWNIPLLSLDHIWVSKDLNILKTKKIVTFKSDHSMLKTYIEL